MWDSVMDKKYQLAKVDIKSQTNISNETIFIINIIGEIIFENFNVEYEQTKIKDLILSKDSISDIITHLKRFKWLSLVDRFHLKMIYNFSNETQNINLWLSDFMDNYQQQKNKNKKLRLSDYINEKLNKTIENNETICRQSN